MNVQRAAGIVGLRGFAVCPVSVKPSSFGVLGGEEPSVKLQNASEDRPSGHRLGSALVWSPGGVTFWKNQEYPINVIDFVSRSKYH